MTIINIGSCCIDHVYHVPHFVFPGETLHCVNYEVHPGGKGLNQSVAMARAGAIVQHAGKIGRDGAWLKTMMANNGIDTSLLLEADVATGHANIQVTPDGENAIVLFGGANLTLTEDEISAALATSNPGDFLVLQNEVSHVATAIRLGADRGLRVIFNAAPMTPEVAALPLEKLEMIIINEVEGEALTGRIVPAEILSGIAAKYPSLKVVLTLGEKGALYAEQGVQCSARFPSAGVVDTTGAGDTFTGYFIAGLADNQAPESALFFACKAAAISVTRRGAASSIPSKTEVQAATEAAAGSA